MVFLFVLGVHCAKSWKLLEFGKLKLWLDQKKAVKTNLEHKALNERGLVLVAVGNCVWESLLGCKSSPLEAMLRSGVTVVMHDVVMSSWDSSSIPAGIESRTVSLAENQGIAPQN